MSFEFEDALLAEFLEARPFIVDSLGFVEGTITAAQEKRVKKEFLEQVGEMLERMPGDE